MTTKFPEVKCIKSNAITYYFYIVEPKNCESTVCLWGGTNTNEYEDKFSFCSDCFEEMQMGYQSLQGSK